MILDAKKHAKQQKGIVSMLKRLPIALAQIKAGNNSESLLNEIRLTVYFLYRSKKVTKMYTTT